MVNPLPSDFTHLRVHSDKSLIDSILSTKNLIKIAIEHKMHSVVVNDLCNMYGFIPFYQKARKAGIKPIASAEILIVNRNNCYVLPLFAKNNTGYYNLLKLITCAYQNLQGTKLLGLEQFHYLPKITSQQLFKYTDGLIALSGGLEGELSALLLNGNKKMQQEYVKNYREAFAGEFYIELQRLGMADEEQYNQLAIKLANEFEVPIVATNSVRFQRLEDYKAHNIRYCINAKLKISDASVKTRYSQQQYFKSMEEMQQIFSDIPGAVENASLVAKKCNVELELGKPRLPDYQPMPGKTVTQELAYRADLGLQKRLEQNYRVEELTSAVQKTYNKRLQIELDVISKMHFADYFLIVWQLTSYAIDNNISMGPGRGSGVGSLVAYSLRITNLDPIKYGLLFERFLNSGRSSMPDFDLDYSPLRRQDIIKHACDLYGAKNVAQIVTFQRLGAKGVVRDVARVLGKSNGLANHIASIIPNPDDKLVDLLGIAESSDSLSEEGEGVGDDETKKADPSPQLQRLVQVDVDAKQICNYAMKLEGLVRNIGTHAAGIVITPTNFADFSPLTQNENGEYVVQYDKTSIESTGLVKFDLLGLNTLVLLDQAQEMIQKKHPEFSITQLSFDDHKTYKTIGSGNTLGLFQIEGKGMTKYILQIPPNNLEEVSTILALYRPGPLESGMLNNYIDRVNHKQEIAYPEKGLDFKEFEPFLGSTKGVLAYQEQVMEMARHFSGLSLNKAEDLRSAMSKKNKEKMDKLEVEFIVGSVKNGKDEAVAKKLFALISKFANYGFNKSHSIAYAAICYYTAYLKTHYPLQFMVALMSQNHNAFFKLNACRSNCSEMDIEVLSPHINYAQILFSESSRQPNAIEYAFIAIKGVGEAISEFIVEERNKNGKYKNFDDFCYRVVSKQSQSSVANLKKLIQAGFFDGLYPEISKEIVRQQLQGNLEQVYQQSLQKNESQLRGFSDLFETEKSVTKLSHFSEEDGLTEEQMLLQEWGSIGYFFSGHPVNSYLKEFGKIETVALKDLTSVGSEQTICGWMTDVRELKLNNSSAKGNQKKKKSGSNKKFHIQFTLSVGDEILQLRVTEDIYRDRVEEFQENSPVIVELSKVEHFLSKDENQYVLSPSVADVMSLASYRLQHLKGVILQINQLKRSTIDSTIQLLQESKAAKGHTVHLEYKKFDIVGNFACRHLVDLNSTLVKKLRDHLGSERISWHY